MTPPPFIRKLQMKTLAWWCLTPDSMVSIRRQMPSARMWKNKTLIAIVENSMEVSQKNKNRAYLWPHDPAWGRVCSQGKKSAWQEISAPISTAAVFTIKKMVNKYKNSKWVRKKSVKTGKGYGQRFFSRKYTDGQQVPEKMFSITSPQETGNLGKQQKITGIGEDVKKPKLLCPVSCREKW